MRKIFVMLSLLAAAVTHAAEQPQRVSVETPHMSLVLEVSKDMQPAMSTLASVSASMTSTTPYLWRAPPSIPPTGRNWCMNPHSP